MSSGDHEFKLRHLPEWFLGITGLLYISGYFIVSLNLGRIGIIDAGGDYLKLRYIVAGMLYFLPYLIILLPFLAMINAGRVRHTQLADKAEYKEKPNELFKAKMLYTVKAGLSFSNMIVYLTVIGILLYFAPHNFIKEEWILVLFLSLFAVFGLALSIIYDSKSDKKGIVPYVFRLLPLVAVLVIGILLITKKDIYSTLIEVKERPGTKLFLLFLLLITLTYISFSLKIKNSPQEMTNPVIFIGICIVGTLYILNVIAFAFSIYSYIPAYKGGADLSEMLDATIWFRDNYNEPRIPSIAKDIYAGDKGLKSEKVKVIHETPSVIYVAKINDAGGANAWRKGVGPTIYSIRRENIASIVYTRRENIASIVYTLNTLYFIRKDFDNTKQIEKLCQKLTQDGVKLDSCKIVTLNNVLHVTELYDKIITKHSIKQNDQLQSLVKETNNIRKQHYSDIRKDEQEKIIKLNRILMELAYAPDCPVSSYVAIQ
ncbi:MAG: hypothetical protein HQK96_02155 [Nitrospirae bacterium]|nr:hypothetical protein [Nitrospirota bacterium]